MYKMYSSNRKILIAEIKSSKLEIILKLAFILVTVIDIKVAMIRATFLVF